MLTKEGPKTAYEGDVIEYTLEIENSGMTIIEGAEVLVRCHTDTVDAEHVLLNDASNSNVSHDSQANRVGRFTQQLPSCGYHA